MKKEDIERARLVVDGNAELKKLWLAFQRLGLSEAESYFATLGRQFSESTGDPFALLGGNRDIEWRRAGIDSMH